MRRRWHHSHLEWHKAYLSSSGVPGNVPPAISRGKDIQENSVISVFHGSLCLRDCYIRDSILEISRLTGTQYCVEKALSFSIFHVIPIEMVWIQFTTLSLWSGLLVSSSEGWIAPWVGWSLVCPGVRWEWEWVWVGPRTPHRLPRIEVLVPHG